MIEVDLVNLLKNNVEVSALIGTRIYPLVAPQNVVNPYITYQVINGKDEQCLSGGIYQEDIRFQIDCWSKSYSNVKAIRTAVKNSLIGFKSSNNINVMDDYEAETLLFRQIIDFKLKG